MRVSLGIPMWNKSTGQKARLGSVRADGSSGSMAATSDPVWLGSHVYRVVGSS